MYICMWVDDNSDNRQKDLEEKHKKDAKPINGWDSYKSPDKKILVRELESQDFPGRK